MNNENVHVKTGKRKRYGRDRERVQRETRIGDSNVTSESQVGEIKNKRDGGETRGMNAGRNKETPNEVVR